MRPTQALPGESIRLDGSGFDLSATYTVQVGNEEAIVSTVTETELTFIAPDPINSGEVTISDGENSITAPYALRKSKEISGRLELPLGVDASQYQVAHGIVPIPVDGNNQFSLRTGSEEVSFIYAFNEADPEGPIFASLITPGISEMVIDAHSTAVAIAFMSLELLTRDPETAKMRREALTEVAATARAAGIISATSAPGVDYFNDQRLVDVLGDMLQSVRSVSASQQFTERSAGLPDGILSKSLSTKSAAATSSGSKANFTFNGGESIDLNQDFDHYQPLGSLVVEGTSNKGQGRNEVDITVSKRYDLLQPVDWYVEVYEIDPAPYATITEVRQLGGDHIPSYLNDKKPIATGYVRADLFYANFDIIEMLSKKLIGSLGIGDIGFKLKLPRDRPGLYMVQAYSGNFFYGSAYHPINVFGENQVELLNAVDHNGLWKWALGANLMATAIDTVSIVLPASDAIDVFFPGKANAKTQEKQMKTMLGLVDALIVNLGKTGTSILAAPGSTGAGTTSAKQMEELIYEMMQSSVQGFVGLIVSMSEEAIEKAVKEGGTTVVKTAAGGVKFGLKSIDVLGKVASAGQVIERFSGLNQFNTRAIERYLISIENPYRPFISHVNPASGPPGTILQILGDNFTNDSDESQISGATLCTYENNDPDGAVSSIAPLEILSVGRGVVRAQIPDTAIEALGSSGGRAHICLFSTDGESSFSTIQIPENTGIFIEPYPVILSTSLGDNPTITDETKQLTLWINDLTATQEEIIVKAYNAEGIEITAPSVVDVHQNAVVLDFEFAALRLGSQMSLTLQRRTIVDDPETEYSQETIRPLSPERYTLTVIDAPRTQLEGGIDLVVDSLDNTIADDGVLTLLEAMLIASEGIESTYSGGSIEGPRPCENSSLGFCAPNTMKDYQAMNSNNRGTTPFANFSIIQAPDNDSEAYRLGGGGVLSSDRVRLHEDLKAQIETTPGLTWTPNQALPKFQSGDAFYLSGLIISGASLPGNTVAADFTEVNSAEVWDVTFKDFSGDGLILSGTLNKPATNNEFYRTVFENCGGRGVVLSGYVFDNSLRGVQVRGSLGTALILNGSNVRGNQIRPIFGFTESFLNGFDRSKQGYGVHLQGGAHDNTIEFSSASGNALGGIRIEGEETDGNIIGSGTNSFNVRYPINYVEGNGGHGIYLGAGIENTLLRFVNIAGNAGDGIRFEGVNNRHNTAMGISMGQFLGAVGTSEDTQNTGNGILIRGGASNILIGNDETRRFAAGIIGSVTGDDRNYIYGNGKNGIHIEGPDSGSIRIVTTYVGPSDTSNPLLVNGENNILIDQGSRHNVIGDSSAMWAQFSDFGNGPILSNLTELLGVRAYNGSNGAGILLDDAHENQIVGNSFYGNKIGLHLRNGSSANQIGLPGSPGDYVVQTHLLNAGTSHTISRPHNFFGRNEDACILLEDAGGRLDEVDEVVGANVFQGNFIGAINEFLGATNPDVGLKITGNSFYNVFGGADVSAGNYFGHTNVAGVLFDGYIQGDSEQRNIFRNNRFQSNGLFFREVGFEYGAAQGYDLVKGHGLVVHDSDGVIFGEDIQTPNTFTRNNFGIYIDNSSGTVVRGNVFDNNDNLAIVIYRGSGNVIGEPEAGHQNRFINNGDSDQETEGAVSLYFSANNIIQANLFGEIEEREREPSDLRLGNRGPSIYINGSTGTLIGGAFKPEGNTIVQNKGPGVLIENGARENIIGNNRIGTLDSHFLTEDEDYLGNDGAGIILRNNAHHNQIGGSIPAILDGSILDVPVGNVIARSGDSGIIIDGSGSVNNWIAYNSISKKGGSGIELSNGGNGSIPTPTLYEFDGSTLSSEATATPEVPEGATIQVFSSFDDGDPQGFSYLGESTVASDGAWSVGGLGLASGTDLSLTVTLPDGNSSSFVQIPIAAAYEIHGPEEGAPVENFSVNRLYQSVLPLEVSAKGTRVRMNAITLDAQSSFDERQLEAVEIYWDSDNNGQLNSSDILLGGPSNFSLDNGSLRIALSDPILNPGEMQHWLVVYRFSPDALPSIGDSFGLSISDASGVEAQFPGTGLKVNATSETTFPIVSKGFNVEEDGFTIWVGENFPGNEASIEISGPEADPDGDGRVNLIEYLEGTDPNMATPLKQEHLTIENGFLVYRQSRVTGRDDVVMIPEFSFDLSQPFYGTALFAQPTIEEGPEGSEILVFQSLISVDEMTAAFIRMRFER